MIPNLRVATWNLGEARLGNLPAVTGALQAMNADLVFLNEVMRGDGWADSRYGVNSARDLQARLGYPYLETLDTSVLGPFVGSGVKMVAILSRFPLMNPNPQEAIEDPLWTGRYRALEVQAVIGARTWYLYSLRFSAYQYPNFERHCALLRDRILALPPSAPVIAAGDFNGGAHHYKAFRDNGRVDVTVVQRGPPPPIADLISRAGLSSVTERFPLRPEEIDPQKPEDWLPPHFPATDMILFRGDFEAVSATERGFDCSYMEPPSLFKPQGELIKGPDHPMVIADFAPRGTTATLEIVDQLLLRKRPKAKPPRRPRTDRIIRPPVQ